MMQKAGHLLDKGRAALQLLGKRPQVAPTPFDVIYRSNKLALMRYRPPPGTARRHPVPLLMVPSLINRYYILDLMPGRSVVAYLVSQGFDVFMIDWGRPGPEDRYLGFDDHFTGLLRRSVLRAAACAGTGEVSLLGYCMGGTFAAIYAALDPARVRNLITLATPVDFADAGLLGLWTRSEHMRPDLLVDSLGNVPWPLLQATFHMLVPTLFAHKALFLYDRLTDNDFVDHFLSLETWGNDNVSFPGECFRRYVKDLYRGNKLVKGELVVGGRTVNLREVRCPLLNVVALGDHIVPEQSSLPLNDLCGSADRQLWKRPGGHIGAIVSRNAARELWPALAEWLAARSHG
jgi:polyhydroxyalkanoate synthase